MWCLALYGAHMALLSDLAAQRPAAGAIPPDGEGAAWIGALGGDGPDREAALTQLRALVTGVAWFEIARRREQLRDLSAAQLKRLVRDAGDRACAALLEQLRDYRGQSRFEVWAAKYGIREAGAAARRHSGSPR